MINMYGRFVNNNPYLDRYHLQYSNSFTKTSDVSRAKYLFDSKMYNQATSDLMNTNDFVVILHLCENIGVGLDPAGRG